MSFWEKPRQPFTGLALSAAAGICVAECCAASPWVVVPLILVAGLILFRWPRTVPVLLFTAAAFYTLHLFNFHLGAGRALAAEIGTQSRVVQASGIVIDEPQATGASRWGARSRFHIRLEQITLDGTMRSCDAKVAAQWAGVPPAYGDRVKFTGNARGILQPRNPGQFDYASYLKRQDIYSEIRLQYPSDGSVLSSGHGNLLMEFAHQARRWMQSKLSLDLQDSPEIAGLIQSLVLGLKNETPEETRELFQRTGTMHLFVVNGLHVGLFALIAWVLIRPLGVTRRRSVFVIIPLLAFYALVTGLSPGSVRATIMAGIVLGAHLADRKSLSFNNLAAAAFGILLWDTNELFMPGFQFSFGVVFSIMLLAGRFQRFFARFGQPDPFVPRVLWTVWQQAGAVSSKVVAGLLGVSVSAWLGSLAFTVTYFHLLTPSALIANLFVVPAAFLVLGHGILTMTTALFSSTVAAIFNNTNWCVARLLLLVVQGFAHVPGSHVYVELPRFKESPVCEFTVFDLGAGGAIHLRAEGRDWLINTGNGFAYEGIVRNALRMRGVNRLDGLILTHGNAAHVGAATMALEDFNPLQIVDSALLDRSRSRRLFHAELASRALGKGIFERGDMLELSPRVHARILYPPAGIEARSSDDKCLVLQLDVCGSRVLLMANSGFFTEQWLVKNEPELRSDILIKGWHGSDLSGTPGFLDAVHPQLIICSAASFPESVSIPESWTADVAKRAIRLFRMDETGAVHVGITADDCEVRAYLGESIFRTSRR